MNKSMIVLAAMIIVISLTNAFASNITDDDVRRPFIPGREQNLF